jgi:hypothetical protein
VNVFRQHTFSKGLLVVVLLPFAQIEPLNTVVAKRKKQKQKRSKTQKQKKAVKKNTSARPNRTGVSVWDRQHELVFLNTRIMVFCWDVVLW